jgi:hypothetical protein
MAASPHLLERIKESFELLTNMENQYNTFDSFYKNYFLVGHQHKHTKLFHFLAIALAIIFGVAFLLTLIFWFLALAILTGYGLSIISHYLFEKNKPATYEYPVYSFFSAFRMFFETLIGRHKIL